MAYRPELNMIYLCKQSQYMTLRDMRKIGVHNIHKEEYDFNYAMQ